VAVILELRIKGAVMLLYEDNTKQRDDVVLLLLLQTKRWRLDVNWMCCATRSKYGAAFWK
jgi:hypothetical protein